VTRCRLDVPENEDSATQEIYTSDDEKISITVDRADPTQLHITLELPNEAETRDRALALLRWVLTQDTGMTEESYASRRAPRWAKPME